jgi:hypothetical protein
MCIPLNLTYLSKPNQQSLKNHLARAYQTELGVRAYGFPMFLKHQTRDKREPTFCYGTVIFISAAPLIYQPALPAGL